MAFTFGDAPHLFLVELSSAVTVEATSRSNALDTYLMQPRDDATILDNLEAFDATHSDECPCGGTYTEKEGTS